MYYALFDQFYALLTFQDLFFLKDRYPKKPQIIEYYLYIKA